MKSRLKKIAEDLGENVYKDPMHGQIAKGNFIYGVKQAEMEMVEWIWENVGLYVNEQGFVDTAKLTKDMCKYMED